MKNTRRFAAFVASVLAVACMAAPMAASFSAEAATVKVDTAGTSEGLKDVATHTYTAYQIFAGTYNVDLGLTVTDWATGYNSSGLLADTAFKAIVLEAAVQDDPSTTEVDESKPAVTIGSFIGTKTDAPTVAQAIEKIADKSVTADTLAELLAKYVGASQTGTVITTDGVSLNDGYYVVKDTYTVGTNPITNDALSKFILRVSGGDGTITINPKKSYPSVEKKVLENATNEVTGKPDNDPTTTEKWNDVADYNIGDTVKFKLYGTLPDTLADYTNGYKYVFHDSIAESLTLVDGSDDGTDVDVVVKINGTTITSGYTVVNDKDGHGFTVTFDNIKAIDNVTADSVVTVEYSAVLNTNAVIGLPGQQNEVYLEYSNNPEWSGTGTDNTTDRTPDDKVIVFTYELDGTKQDKATQAKLAGAQFVIYRGTAGAEEYAVLDANNKVTDWLKGTLSVSDDGTVSFTKTSSANETSATTPTVLTSDVDGLFKIVGVDEGTYYAKETKAPDKYNLLEEDVELVLEASTNNNQDWDDFDPEKALTKLELTVDAGTKTEQDATNHGVAAYNVDNSKGTELPGTGGMGTTLFYVGGGALVVGAGVLLVTKKRMANK